MKQFAAMMMFLSWLLYGAMPAMADMPMAGPATNTNIGAVMADHDMPGHVMSGHASPEHSGHGNIAQSNPMHGEKQQPCPHKSDGAGKICVAPFCSACLVMPPHIVFSDSGRFVHGYPRPETGPSLVVSGPAPLIPPPRA